MGRPPDTGLLVLVIANKSAKRLRSQSSLVGKESIFWEYLSIMTTLGLKGVQYIESSISMDNA